MKAITLTVHVTRIASRVDNSVSLAMVTAKELDASGKLALLELQNLECRILVQPVGTEGEGIKEIKGEFDNKTPSQRARATLFVLWRHLTDTNQIEITFETFYLRQMEKFIESLKTQLPEKVY